MTHPENEFGDFEQDFQSTPKSAPGMVGPEHVPPGTYKVVCSEQDAKSDGKLVDHEVFTTKTKGTKGFKLFLEIVEPAEMVEETTGEKVKTKGKVIEATFWVTQKAIGQLKRDVATILGRDLKTLGELTSIVWLGKTCEVGVRDETYQGYTKSRPNFFNAWKPGDGKKADPTKPDAKATAAAAPAAGGAAPGKEDEGDPNF